MDIKADFWKDYRRVTGKLTWRLATPDDLPRIRRIKNVSERFLNQKQKNIPLFDPPVLLTLVAENAEAKIVDCLYIEAQVELVKMGCSPESLAELAGLEEDLTIYFKSLGIKTVLATTLKKRADGMAPGLTDLGFKSCESIWSYFRKYL